MNQASKDAVIKNMRPVTPIDISRIQSSDSSVTIEWTNTLGKQIDVTDKWYEVYENSGPNGEFEKLPKNFGINSYTATSLVAAKVYKFKVRARNCCDPSGFTKEFPVTVFKKPEKPVLPCPESTCDGQMKFSWEAPVNHNSAITAIEFIVLDSNN